jgi:hypothetical protein
LGRIAQASAGAVERQSINNLSLRPFDRWAR